MAERVRKKSRRQARGEEASRPAGSTSKSAPRGGTWLQNALTAGLVILPAAAYLNALDNPFVYDDGATVVTNPSLQDSSNLAYVLVYERFRPLVNLSYALDHRLWGLWPFGYHLTNLVLHIVNVLLFFSVVQHMQRDRGTGDSHPAGSWKTLALPAFVAAIFAVHPMMTEAVGYVSGRAEVLCATFFLAAWLWLRRAIVQNRKLLLIPALLTWCLALASKEVAVMLPAVAILYDFILLEPERRRESKRLFWLHLPFLALVATMGVARASAYLGSEASFEPTAFFRYFLTELVVIWRYIGLLLLPVHQSVVHSVREMTHVSTAVFLAGVGLMAVVWLAWRFRRKWPLAALGAFWFLLLLLPTTIVPLRELMAEHRVYLASCGFFLLVGELLNGAAQWLKSAERSGDSTPATVAAMAIVGVLCVATMARNAVWDDPVSLWRDAATKAPDVNAPHYQLGNVLRENGDCNEAIPHYRRAVDLVPEHWNAWNNLGICLASLKRYDEARWTFQKAIELQPTYARGYNNLGTLAKSQGLFAEARQHFLRALELDPGNEIAAQQLNALPDISPASSQSVQP
ncbi:MAG: tetratricopeptide repeat protein [Vicinamibacteria bacterium]